MLAALFSRSNDTEAFVRYSAVEVRQMLSENRFQAVSHLAAEGNEEVVNLMLELGSDRDVEHLELLLRRSQRHGCAAVRLKLWAGWP